MEIVRPGFSRNNLKFKYLTLNVGDNILVEKLEIYLGRIPWLIVSQSP